MIPTYTKLQFRRRWMYCSSLRNPRWSASSLNDSMGLHGSGNEEDEESNDSDRFQPPLQNLNFSPNPVDSFEEAREGGNSSAEIIVGEEEVEEINNFYGILSPFQNPNFSPNPADSFEEAGEGGNSSAEMIIGEGDGDEINNFYGFQIPSNRPSPVHSSGGEEDWDFYDPEGSRSPKRRKTSQEEDRISSFPDDVLLHIISFLPAESAIRTGVLAKRWRHLWEFSPNLIFNFKDVRSRFSSFVHLVDSTLILYSSPKIRKFHIHTSCPPVIPSQKSKFKQLFPVGSWLAFAVRHNVENLSLKFSHPKFPWSGPIQSYHNKYAVPQHLFNSSSLTKLSSTHCDYEPQAQVSWGSLSKLTIGFTTLSNDVLQKILLGSPVLNCLSLKGVEIDRIDVSSNSGLERLVVKNVRHVTDEGMEISIPNVKSLEVLVSWSDLKIRLLNAPSLVSARVELKWFDDDVERPYNSNESDFVDMVRQLLQQINHVKQLTLGGMCIQSVTFSFGRLQIQIFNTEVDLYNFEFPGLAVLLDNSPTLEKLVLDFSETDQGMLSSLESHCEFDEDFWTSQSQRRNLSCLHGHLKTVEFVGLVEEFSCTGPLGTIMNFFLQHASVLEKMVMRPVRFVHFFPSNWYRWAQKLLTIRKASPHVMIFLPDQRVKY